MVTALLVSLFPALGCSPRYFAERLLVHGHFVLLRDLPYGSDARQRLDIYRPRSSAQPAPVVVFLYGSRWQHGAKQEYRLLGDALTGRGIVAVVPDYRLYPEVRFPAWVEDAARAVRWVRDSIGWFGGDPTRIFVVGHSSGGHTAAVLALDEHYLRDAGLPARAVRGFVSIAGPVAEPWTAPDVQALMGPREGWPATYPMELVRGSAPPILLLHGGRDHIVPEANSVRLGTAIRASGGCARVITYSGLDHVGIVLALALPRFPIAPVLEDLAEFVRHPSMACS